MNELGRIVRVLTDNLALGQLVSLGVGLLAGICWQLYKRAAVVKGEVREG